jgi:hypothetical protein
MYPRDITWMEGEGASAHVKIGNKDGSSPKAVGRSRDFTGDETAIVYNKPLRKYYIIVNDQLVEYDPVTFRKKVLHKGVSAVSVDPDSKVIFSSPNDDNKSQVFLFTFIVLI